MLSRIFDEFKATPDRFSTQRDAITKEAKARANQVLTQADEVKDQVVERANQVKNDGEDVLWGFQTDALEQLTAWLGQAPDMPLLNPITDKAKTLISERLDAITSLQIEDYDVLNAKDAIRAAKSLSNRCALLSLHRYEASNKNRKTVLTAIENALGY